MTVLTPSRAILGVLAALLVVVVLTVLATCSGRASSTDTGSEEQRVSGAIELEIGPPARLDLEGGTPAPLRPGLSRSLDLALGNPHSEPVVLTELSVVVGSVRAPRATAELPCSDADFDTAPGELIELMLPAGIETSLSAESVAPEQWPSLRMVAADRNQDGCKGATVVLEYRASGRVS